MGKPRMIILIRHAQSEGNKNREIHQTIPDHRVNLTPEGHRQALEAGTKLRALLRPDDKIHFFTSPYRRTRETTEGILQSLTADSPAPSPFPRHTIKVYEEPRLREQDFGNFQPCSAEMERMWLERADYGHFFYRIPNGESAADAYDRVSGFNESLWRLFGEQDFASVCVLVTHGLMTRVFLMKWYHWSVEYFEDLRNINHCEFVIMKLNEDNGKYILQNQLRTWSELRKEKELERQRERATRGLAASHPPSPLDSPIPIRRKWGGCPDGCSHGLHRKSSLRSSRAHAADHAHHDHDAQHKVVHRVAQDSVAQRSSSASSSSPAATTEAQMLTAPEPALGDRSADTKPIEKTIPSPTPQYCFPGQDNSMNSSSSMQNTRTNLQLQSIQANTMANMSHLPTPESLLKSLSLIPRRPDLLRFQRDSEDHLLHPPQSNYGLLHLVGRDGGGTLSGANSVAPSEDEQDSIKLEESPSTSSAAKGSFHQPRPSQDLGNDGDDEGSGRQTPKSRRTRPHNHHRHLPTPGRRSLTKKLFKMEETPEGIRTDSLKQDGDEKEGEWGESEHDDDNESQPDHSNQSQTGDNYDEALEAARQEDQSIRGSVY
ncbi:hypothetical protein P175DRAFT_0556602 [Aspergillus ochraceoroseus IBT 24754]|uniref:Phosphoglycerate mutase-like protein n=2 Tax=Aspergillus ochraceoroseus TaxID=138278 RepID=A0A2T5LZC6_9EURO|nr:uncharacterized protein P175DRAFT_0556602 [Aspergillus ochraceoroseus IBT 24754]KKK16764.1 hypothetical protein AOCH_006692 [Aspergillus ochraceoroseus]PTU21641.1 hypothetical protein P175DRAFT_0556602 [Aspergillus ochraceoroseus IBT 24754]